MVATKLSEVVSKGYEWASGETPSKSSSSSSRSNPSNTAANVSQDSNNGGQQLPESSPSLSSSYFSIWDAASNKLSYAADQAYSRLTDVASYAGLDTHKNSQKKEDESLSDASSGQNSFFQLGLYPGERKFSFGSPLRRVNPYSGVRENYANHRSTLSAVRSLLPLVEEDNDDWPLLTDVSEHSDGPSEHRSSDLAAAEPVESRSNHGLVATPPPRPLASSGRRNSSIYTMDPPSLPGESSLPKRLSKRRKNSETASQLAEGTVRALRDMTLDEAVEFHEALRFWSDRWEHPLLSWLEAGPTVWFSKDGYNHQVVGYKVAQIQAVLARRCAVIGELQQHLLRAGWQRGVAQWAVLGHGGQWATVRGTTVMAEDTAAKAAASQTLDSQRQLSRSNIGESMNDLDSSKHTLLKHSKIGANDQVSPKKKDKKTSREKGYYASVFVRNESDGQILMDDAALAEWSVDAMELIRNLLIRASNGNVTLPCKENWNPQLTDEMQSRQLPPPRRKQFTSQKDSSYGLVSEFDDQGDMVTDEQPTYTDPHRQLPAWAKWAPKGNPDDEMEQSRANVNGDEHPLGDEEVVICSLPLMAAEVSKLLNSIEEIMSTQKQRRLRKLRPPSMFRRRWYLSAVAAPISFYTVYSLIQKGFGSKVIQLAVMKLLQFFKERVYQPSLAIIEEVWKGREGMSDRRARMEVIAGLKEMIRSWLNDNHPELSPDERALMAEVMDISLIERAKTESMKTIFELNQAVRLSFIEMQFIKKEMVNALYQMDDMMSANDINMNLAAVTPAVLMLYTAKQVFKFFYYALLKLGKSREETYASFRQILTDIERLLVMRNNPPHSPFPQQNRRHGENEEDTASQSQFVSQDATSSSNNNVLSSDDLGMLMLHIHECRTILWRDNSRFTPGVIQSVSEDLAELAGERGAVSVQQQLQIISRMCRTYPFLKVISIGTTFHERFIG